MTGVVVVAVTMVASITVAVGDIQARQRPGLWVMLMCHGLLIVLLAGLSRRRSVKADIASGVLLSTAALMAATSLTWTGTGELPVSAESARFLPSSAMHVQLVLIALFIRRRRWVLLGVIATVAGTVWLAGLSGNPAVAISVDDRVMSGAYALTAMTLVRALRRAARDAAALAERHREVRTEVIASSNAQLADEEGRRVVHDHVLSALATAQAGRDPDEVAEACERALTDLRTLDPTTSAADLRDALLRKERPRVRISGGGWPISPPPRVMSALRESAGEAIRNADRHARVDEVSVALTGTRQGQAEVVIHDTGRGFDPTQTPGFGLSESIVGRMAQVGGEARVESAPGMGTTVRLLWPRQSSLEVPVSSGVLAPGNRSRLYVRTALPVVLTVLFIALHHAGESRLPVLSVILAGLLGAALLGCALLVGRARPTWPLVLAVVLFNSTVTAAAVTLGPTRMLVSLDAWPVIGCSFVIGGMALAARVPQVAVLAAAETATIAMAALRAPDVGAFEPVGSLLMPLAYAAAGLTMGAVLRRGGSMVGVEEALIDARMEEAGWVESSEAARHRYAEQLQANVAPFLKYCADDRPTSTEQLRAHAGVLAAQCRDLLAMSDAMPAPVRTAVLAARNRGVRVAIRNAPSVSPVAWALLSAVLRHAATADAVTLIPGRPESTARVTVIPRLPSRTEAEIRTSLHRHTMWVEHTDVTTSFTLVSPEWRPSTSSG